MAAQLCLLVCPNSEISAGVRTAQQHIARRFILREDAEGFGRWTPPSTKGDTWDRGKQIPILQPTDGLCSDPAPKYWDEEAHKKAETTRVFEICHGSRMCLKNKCRTRLERI